MHHSTSYALTLLTVACSLSLAIYVPLTEYAGETFFDAWDFDGNIDDTTWGNVTYLNKAAAMSSNLVYVDETTGHAIIRVDNTTNLSNAPTVYRDSVRIVSQNTYTEGNLIIMDVAHMPAGCSVWPSFWTLGVGEAWPATGEIDIIEGVNLVHNNQMTLHTIPTNPGCVHASNALQSGKTLRTNCSSTTEKNSGCGILETKANSFGSGFNDAGGGVFATQIDSSGVYVWFWSRPNVPTSISNATNTSNIDTATFGTPSATFSSSGCNISEFFGPQKLIILTTLCGHWAGSPEVYSQTCPGTCLSNVMGDGSAYNDAWWDIAFIRIYQAEDQAPATPSTLLPATPITSHIGTATLHSHHYGSGALNIKKDSTLRGLILSGILFLLGIL